ncbi:hypothetical protein KY092_18315 [Natronomonas gomsonensis]|jgi:hypothetical protein|uniref:DUF7504 family protein n=1 Tax=Natronomonas gomsonensis TaxID=1046043 RepID=UPI0020CA55DA|nr:hypothetical protein [Natronomonas gomsonensis]MCY4732498.1 hypothetical protein [Natronomonas gomsonensis]
MSSAGALDDIADVSNVLVLGPSVDESVDIGCKRLLTAGEEEAVLVVSFMLSPKQWVEGWIERVGDLPEELVVVTTSDAFTQPGETEENLPDSVTVEYLSSPGDLTGIGMVVSKYLERWHEADREMAVCFDSLTTLLQYGETHSIYRFLHLITTRISGADARAHFHLDPDTQDKQTVSTITSTFQAIARHTDSGWEVKRR